MFKEIYYAHSFTLVGPLFIAKTNRGVCSILLGLSPEVAQQALSKQFHDHKIEYSPDSLKPEIKLISAKIKSPDMKTNVQLDIQGTAFQKKVWNALCDIPWGETRSYKNIAEQLGQPKAFRAVANACAANKLAILIPCHRVIRSDGKLSGYRWGDEIKRQLLKLESVN